VTEDALGVIAGLLSTSTKPVTDNEFVVTPEAYLPMLNVEVDVVPLHAYNLKVIVLLFDTF